MSCLAAAAGVDEAGGRVAATRLAAGEEAGSEDNEGDGLGSGVGVAAVLGPPNRGCSSGVPETPLFAGVTRGGCGVLTGTNVEAEGDCAGVEG